MDRQKARESLQKAENLLLKYREELNEHATIDSYASLLSPPTCPSQESITHPVSPASRDYTMDW